MQKLSCDIINLSLEKDTENTPTKGLFYLFKDGKIIAQNKKYQELKSKYDEIKDANKTRISKATRKFREKSKNSSSYSDLYANWISNSSSMSNFLGERPRRSVAEKLIVKKDDNNKS